MTGFARAEGRSGAQSWYWEIRSVNGRGLDLRFRLPPGFDAIEPPARQLAGERLKRGNVTANLQLGPSAVSATYRVNRELLRELATLAHEAQNWIEAAPPRLDGLLAVRGVVEPVEPPEDPAATAAREAALLQSFAHAIDQLVSARAGEGAKLGAVLGQIVEEIARLAVAARVTASARPDALRARLREQVAELLAASAPINEERLAQELAILATRSDVREELDRLDAHIASARELLQGGTPGVGRRLDFLSQELNREANTLCSKPNDAALVRIGLDLKVAIDRFREQVQNVE